MTTPTPGQHIKVRWRNNVSGWPWYLVLKVNQNLQTIQLMPINSPDGRYIGHGPVRWFQLDEMLRWEKITGWDQALNSTNTSSDLVSGD